MYNDIKLYHRKPILTEKKLKRCLSIDGDVEYIDILKGEMRAASYIASWLIRRLHEFKSPCGGLCVRYDGIVALYADIVRALDGEYKDIIPIDIPGLEYDDKYRKNLIYWRDVFKSIMDSADKCGEYIFVVYQE